MKKFLALALSLALSLLAGCGNNSSSSGSSAGSGSAAGSGSGSGDSYKIGLVILSGDHGFTGESVRHAKMEVEALMEKYDNLEIVVKSCAEASAQITEIDNLIAGGDIDAIMLWPTEGEVQPSW